MKPLLRALALGVGPMLVAVGVSAGLLVQSPSVKKQLVVPSPASAGQCSQPPKFEIGYQARPGYVILDGGRFRFRSTSWIETNLCSPGVLKVTAIGELAGDEQPQLSVVLGDELLGNFSFSILKTISIAIPRAGYLRLGYFNDYYAADARVATIRSIHFLGNDCQEFKNVDISKSVGSSWNIDTQTARLTRGGSISLVPCSIGVVSMGVQGREGSGEFPVVDISQGQKLIDSIRTGADVKSVEFNVTSEPFEIKIINPYFENAADRNLDINSIKFISK